MVLNKRDLERAFSPSKMRKKRKLLTKGDAESSANMRVVVRIRPENAKELQGGSRSVIKVVEDNTLIFDPKEDTPGFFYHGVQQSRRDLLKKQNKEVECVFDQVFDSNTTNQEVFDGSTKDMIESLLDGYNCSVFAYGATGAGKTFTMLGNKECPGITYLTMSELYRQMNELKEDKDFELGISHLEVYNENVQDLIQPSGPLHLREDGNCGVIVAGLSVHRIQSADELLALLERGNKNRTQHPTDANAESSRSHAVFQVYIRMTSKPSKQTKIVKLSMIDLAGSERGSATGCKGIRFTEGANINRSLLALGNCINNLADGMKHIPYRDSKLTRLLKDSLGGNCRTVMIANISPSSLSYEDTYNTLKYALRAKKIRSTLKKNIVSLQLNGTRYAKLVEELSAEVESLKEKLKQYEKKLKEYESSNAITEAKPSTSKTAEPPPVPKVSDKCTEYLALLESKRAKHKEICKLGKEVKILKWRIKQKLNTARGLSELSISSLEMNETMSRLKSSVSQFERRAASIREKMKGAFSDLSAELSKEVVLSSELEQNGSLNVIAKDIELSKLTLELEEKTLQSEHMEQLLSMQQMENESQFKIIRELCTTLRDYHFTLMGHHKMTHSMSSHYQKLIRMLGGVKAVSFQEDQKTEDSACLLNMKDFCDLSLKTLGKETKQSEISSKIFEEIEVNSSKQFSNISGLTSDSSQSQTVPQGPILNNTTIIVTSSPVKDRVSSQGPDPGAQMEIAFELPSNFQIPKQPVLDCTFSKSETENNAPDAIPKCAINPDVLNSTFEIKASPKKSLSTERKPRVLTDHNRLQLNVPRAGVTSGQSNTRKRPGSTPPEMVKVQCNKENKDMFVKPKLPLPTKNSRPVPLKKSNCTPNLPKLPLNRNIQNIAKLQPATRPLSNAVSASPRYARTPQKQFKQVRPHDL